MFSVFEVFTVQLTLGDQHWEAEGTSIKKAQHAAAAKALEGTKFPKPTARPSRSEGKNPGMCHNKLIQKKVHRINLSGFGMYLKVV